MIERFAQLSLYLADRGGSGRAPSRRLVRGSGNALRRLVLLSSDPVVRYRLEGTQLSLPLSHELPYYRRAFPGYSSNVGRLAAALATRYGDEFRIVDVGANVGDTAAILRRQLAAEILCIEGHPDYVGLLRDNVAKLGAVTVEAALLGAEDNTALAELRSGGGTAGLVRGDTPLRLTTLPAVLDLHPRFRSAKLVKIDTDGWDLEVIAGALEWIAVSRPVLFFEWDPALALPSAGRLAIDLTRDLGSRGYERVMIFANEGGYVLSARLDQQDLLADVLAYYSGRRDRRYCDIAAFPSEDLDVWAQLRVAERARMLA